MHRSIFGWRFLALAAPVIAALAFVLFGGGGSGTRSLAVGPGTATPPGTTPDLTGVTCTDSFLGSTQVGMTMTRIEPHNGTTIDNSWDVTTVSYLGYAGPGGLLPLGPPGPNCHDTTLAALSAPEANRFGGATQVPYSNQYGARPTALATYDPSAQNLTFSVCGYSESQAKWIRVDSSTHITKVNAAAGTENDGTSTLYLGAVAPSAANAVDENGDGVLDTAKHGTDCGTTGAVPFAGTTKSYSRDARTSHTAASDAACGTDTACLRNRALNIPADPDNPTLKTKSTVMNPDSNDGLADNWSGDGCTDWDKLGHGYMPGSLPLLYPPSYTWANTPVNGMDPFNPYDCNLNYTATISMTTTIFHNTGSAGAGAVSAACTTGGSPDCNYFGFRCLGSFTDAKTKDITNHRALSYRLGCYSDSSVTVINSSNPLAGYSSGTSTAVGSGTPGTLTNSTATWTANQFVGFTVTSGGKTMVVASNTATMLTGTTAWVGGAPATGAYTIMTTGCPPAPRQMCGDGKSGAAPPGCIDTPTATPTCSQATAGPAGCTPLSSCNCPSLPCAASRFVYTGIDPATYPVVDAGPTNNYFDTNTNQVHLGGCFAGFGGGAYGNVYGSSTIDAHTGAGSFQIYLNQTLSDCTNGTPMGGAINGQITIVVLRTEKGLPTNCSDGTSDCHKYDSDRDGCADARELGAAGTQSMGGERDPYNPWDYFNPEKVNTPDKQTISDIQKTVNQYGKNLGNVGYTASSDRTAVPGGQVWTLGAPDGKQTVADILAAIGQYNHNCPYSAP